MGIGVAPEQEFTIFGALALALGIGFGIAAFASYLLSRSFGLLERGPNKADSMADRRLFLWMLYGMKSFPSPD